MRVKFRIYPDGRVEETVSGIRGSDCTKVTEELNEKLGKVTQTKPTEDAGGGASRRRSLTRTPARGRQYAVYQCQPAKSPSLIRQVEVALGRLDRLRGGDLDGRLLNDYLRAAAASRRDVAQATGPGGGRARPPPRARASSPSYG